ncbi:MAG: UbiA prenyltransferase family protein [Thermoplasmata archaeon]|nr:UbiA prenyltransferase family protein [Thermoplasmata archaeon]
MIGEYLKLSRSFNVGLTAIAPVLGALSNGEENLFHLFLFFMVGFFGHCYGFALNDIVDYRIDRLSSELVDRPLVSGKISLRNAWIFTIVMLILSFLIALWIAHIYSNFLSFPILVLSAVSITIYDFISKRMPAMDIFVGGGIILLILYGALTVNIHLTHLAYIVALLGTLQVLFMQFIAGGLKDAEHDFKGNAKTLAIKMGVRVEEGEMYIPFSFKMLAYTIQAVYLVFLFYPFYAFEEFRGGVVHIAILSVLSLLMLYASHSLLSMKRFVRNEARKYIGMHYYINFSLVPVMLSVLNPFIALIALIPPAAFVLSNLALHGSILPKTM